MSDKSIETTEDKIDSYLITTNVTLLASFVVLISLNKESFVVKSHLASSAIIFSIVFIFLSLVFSLWHKYRISIRRNYFDQLKKEQQDKMLKQVKSLTDIAGDYVLKTFAEFQLKNHGSKKEKSSEEWMEDFKRKLDSQEKEKMIKMQPLIESVTENTIHNIHNSVKKAFFQPLSERFRKPKFFLDRISQKFRYYTFLLGLLMFVSSVILILLQK